MSQSQLNLGASSTSLYKRAPHFRHLFVVICNCVQVQVLAVILYNSFNTEYMQLRVPILLHSWVILSCISSSSHSLPTYRAYTIWISNVQKQLFSFLTGKFKILNFIQCTPKYCSINMSRMWVTVLAQLGSIPQLSCTSKLIYLKKARRSRALKYLN